MKIAKKTLKNGFSMPEYGIGTWRMGGHRRRDPDNDDKGDIQGIRNALDAGVTHIDTAEIYAGGHSEELVGEAIKGYDRSKLFIASKAQNTSLSYDGILRAVEGSLNRVNTDYFDLYIAHAWSEIAPLKDVIKALDRLMDEKVINNIGVSNYTTAGLKHAMSLANHPITSNQVHYNVRVRQPEDDGLLEFCQQNDVMLVAWRPLEKGAILGKNVEPILASMASKYHKTPAQIALNWLVSQQNVVTLSKTHSKAHLEENLGALGWNMSDQDIEDIRRNYPETIQVSDAVPLKGQ